MYKCICMETLECQKMENVLEILFKGKYNRSKALSKISSTNFVKFCKLKTVCISSK